MSDKIHSIKAAQPRPKKSLFRSFLRTTGMLLVTMLAMAVLVILAVLLMLVSDEARSLFQFIARYRIAAYCMHLVVTVCLWLAWAKIVAWLVKRSLVPESARQVLIERKGRWFAALVTLQLILLASAFGQIA
ncbi:hypothetical protein [Janthinobacterium psychrotolerans]|uniref:Uncharacterized protein n=1 Tax=Janthinobacterium psychrotolerans TaxID=1747903 RepID=A0A1A7C8U0_9BURK|nr:hypothetical protein [Janthinobacterium psychrotolerans]OBV41190.1 hypothetical protein ASR47_102547 [Janthinobacterium psychrotolerans]